jgi:hypothetical protein
MKWKWVALLIGLGLSACVPSQVGASVYNPIEVASPSTTVSLEPGTWYLAYELDESPWGISANELSDAKDPFSVDEKKKGTASVPWFSARPSGSGDGFRAALQSSYVYVFVTEKFSSGSSNNVRYRNGIQLVFGVTIPPNATPGITRAFRFDVVHSNGKSLSVPVLVVVKAATK